MLAVSFRHLLSGQRTRGQINSELADLFKRGIARFLIYSMVTATMPARTDEIAPGKQPAWQLQTSRDPLGLVPAAKVARSFSANPLKMGKIAQRGKLQPTKKGGLKSPELLASTSGVALQPRPLTSTPSENGIVRRETADGNTNGFVELRHDLPELNGNFPELTIADLELGSSFDGFLNFLNLGANSLIPNRDPGAPILPSLRSGLAQAYASLAGGNITVFGPQRYDRTTGLPNQYSATFSLPVGAASPFQLLVQNGDPSGGNRVSSGWITIDGTQVVGPSDFNQNVATIARSVSLTSQNTLQVTLASKPGSYIILNIYGTNPPPTASAGPNQTVYAGTTVQLNGAGSHDPSGLPLTYSWALTSRPSGSTANLSGANTATPTFVADKVGTYTAQLVVNNGYTSSSPSMV